MTLGARLLTCGSLLVLLLAHPRTAAAHATVTVQFTYGGVVVGGVGVFVYFAGAWELPLAQRALQGSLIDVHDGRARLGVPLPGLRLAPGDGDPRAGGLQFDLVRWRF